MKPFKSIFDSLYVENDVIYHGTRIVVPSKQQERLLSELHMTHMGIVKMKIVARQYFVAIKFVILARVVINIGKGQLLHPYVLGHMQEDL